MSGLPTRCWRRPVTRWGGHGTNADGRGDRLRSVRRALDDLDVAVGGKFHGEALGLPAADDRVLRSCHGVAGGDEQGQAADEQGTENAHETPRGWKQRRGLICPCSII